jgi:hypothetical protein
MSPLLAKLKTMALLPTFAAFDVRDVDDADDTDDGPVMEIDANGSVVTLPAADWLVCFVPGLYPQWWHRFAHPRHKHVFAIRPLGDGCWLLVEPWWTRLMVNVLTPDQAAKFLQWGAAGDVLRVREAIPGHGTQLRGWSNCAVLVAFLLGRAYWTWTPHGLYRRLAADASVVAVDTHRLLREHFRRIGKRIAGAALALPSSGESTAPEPALSLDEAD